MSAQLNSTTMDTNSRIENEQEEPSPGDNKCSDLTTSTPEKDEDAAVPERLLNKGLRFNGVPVIMGARKGDTMTHIQNIRDLKMRDDDIFIAAFPKCGTHWMAEILHMLVNGSVSYSSRNKEFAMLEYLEDLGTLEDHVSPRLMNSHLYMAHLPRELFKRKVKLIHLIRNPKDTVVSYYHHLNEDIPEHFTFDNYLKGYTTEGYLNSSHQFDYLRQMSVFEKNNPGHPLMHIHYEDLKKSPVEIIQAVSQFIAVPVSQQFCQEIVDACGLDKLREADVKRSPPDRSKIRSCLYRKGVVGDWKNSFTVAQNEMFDEFVARQEKKGLPYTFRWH